MSAYFRRSLVLAYAFPRQALEPLLPAGLALDTFGDLGFVAVALVETDHMRPSFLPAACGRSVHLTGYRIFARLKTAAGSLRGLRILRSDTDRRWMVWGGNLLTHYHYRFCRTRVAGSAGCLRWSVETPDRRGNLDILADLATPAPLPSGSPFATWAEARRFAGPLPYTFDYEPETHTILRIRCVRSHWDPQPVAVEVRENAFLRQAPFAQFTPVLANAFLVRDTPYHWMRGSRTPLERS
jgi:hypothetical protein